MGSLPENIDLHKLDFDSLYEEGHLAEEGHEAESVDVAAVPWDIGGAQPVVIEAERAGRLQGAVLDVGCGLGDNAIYLASQGHQVTGIDTAASAVAQAQQRARKSGADVSFAVADATSLDGFDGQFDSVLDGACYHCLPEDARDDYAAALHRATRPDGLLTLFCFPPGGSGPVAAMGVPEENLRTTFGKAGWDITDLRLTRYQANGAVRDLATELGFDWEPVPDDDSRIQIPVWAMEARRA
jgi:SAM-dependent methyltransferase